MKEYRKTTRYGTPEHEILQEMELVFGTRGFSKTIRALIHDWKERAE